VWSSNDGLCRMNPGGLHNWSSSIAEDHHRFVDFIIGFENYRMDLVLFRFHKGCQFMLLFNMSTVVY